MGTKLSDLLADHPHTGAALASGDVLPVLDVSDTTEAATGTTKGITASELAIGVAAVGSFATDSELTAHSADTTSVHGIADTSILATATTLATAVSNHAAAVDPHADRAYADTVGNLKLAKASNLSDLANAATARANLGLAAIAASGSASDLSAGTVPSARLGTGGAGLGAKALLDNQTFGDVVVAVDGHIALPASKALVGTDTYVRIRTEAGGVVGLNIGPTSVPYVADASGTGGTGVLKLGAAGTAAEPTYTFTGDLNTGSFRESEDVYGVTVGGVVVFRGRAASGAASSGANFLGVVEAHTAADALTVAESGSSHNNLGATTRIDLTLPTSAPIGTRFTVTCLDTDGVRLIAPTGETIRLAANESATAGRLDSSTIGDSATVEKQTSTAWIAVASVGAGLTVT